MQTSYNKKRKVYSNQNEKTKKQKQVKPKMKIIRQPTTPKRETKVVDGVYNILAQYEPNNPNYILINPVIQGTAKYNRIGDKILIKKISVKASYYLQAPIDTHGVETTRLSLVYDKQPNGALCTYQDIFKGYAGNGQITTSTLAFPYVSNKNRFQPIIDNYYQTPLLIQGGGVVYTWTVNSYKPNSMFFQKEINCDLPVTFYENANAGTIGDYQSGALILALITNSTPPFFAVRIYIRVEFEDN